MSDNVAAQGRFLEAAIASRPPAHTPTINRDGVYGGCSSGGTSHERYSNVAAVPVRRNVSGKPTGSVPTCRARQVTKTRPSSDCRLWRPATASSHGNGGVPTPKSSVSFCGRRPKNKTRKKNTKLKPCRQTTIHRRTGRVTTPSTNILFRILSSIYTCGSAAGLITLLCGGQQSRECTGKTTIRAVRVSDDDDDDDECDDSGGGNDSVVYSRRLPYRRRSH